MLFPFAILAQTFKTSNQPYVAKNGKTYKIGDTLIITTPTDFSDEYKSYVQGRKLNLKKTIEKVTESSETKIDNRNKWFTIKQFRIYEEYGTFAVSDRFFNIMVNIERGLENGEIAGEKHKEYFYKRPKSLTDSIAYINYLYQQKNVTDSNVKEFFYLFDNKKFNSVRQDEFGYNAEMKKTKIFLDKALSKVDTTEKYYIRYEDYLGNYNFDSLSFPLIWENNSLKILSDFWKIFTPEDINKNNVLLSNLTIKFSNTNDFNYLPLNLQRAQSFIKHRKSENGNVDRKIYFGIQFKFKGLEGNKEKILICEICRIDFFEDKDFINYITTLE
jgi:hypothetical protein